MVEAEESQEDTYKEECLEFLAEEGYRPKLDGSVIHFKQEGEEYHIFFRGESGSIFEIYTLERYEKSYLDRSGALELANENNRGILDARVTVMQDEENDDSTWIEFSSTCHYPSLFKDLFANKMLSIGLTIRSFNQELSDRET